MSNWKIVVSGSSKDLEDVYGYKVEQAPGAGMPPVDNISTEFGLLDGRLFQRQRTDARTFTLIGTLHGQSVSDLHEKRKDLIDAIKPDRTSPQQPVVIQYAAGASTIQASAFYDSGLEFGPATVFTEPKIGLRLVMLDPYWEKANSTSAALTAQLEISNASGVLRRNTSGCWQTMNGGVVASPITNMFYNAAGSQVYILGDISSVNGSSASNYAVWKTTSSDWDTSFIKTGGFNNSTHYVAFNAQGAPYVGGAFNIVSSSVTACGIATLSGDGWIAVSGGFPSSSIFHIAIGPDTTIYAAGTHTTSGSGDTASYLSYYTGAGWETVAGGANANVTGLAFSPNGQQLYVSGCFNQVGGSLSACGIAVLEIGASSWSNVGASGASPYNTFPGVIQFDRAGRLYYGADFTKVDNVVASGIAYYESGWHTLGQRLETPAGATVQVSHIKLGNNNELYIDGSFSTAGSIPVDRTTIYNRGIYLPVDFKAPTGAKPSPTIFDDNGDLYTSFYPANGTACTAGMDIVTNNGTATAYPILSASGPGRLYQFVNYTTGHKIYFNLDLQTGEVVTLDLRQRRKTFTSNSRGNIIHTILPSSDLASFAILPGTNNISVFIDGGAASAIVQYTERFWSLDGATG